jgi:NACalpha-BTF3-like transcription factor
MSDEKVIEMPKESVVRTYTISEEDVKLIVEICNVALKATGIQGMSAISKILGIFSK